MSDLSILQGAIVLMAGGAVLLWKIRTWECVCPKCAFHVNERRMDELKAQESNEAERAKRHRERHDAFNLPWPYPICGECRKGHEDDQPR